MGAAELQYRHRQVYLAIAAAAAASAVALPGPPPAAALAILATAVAVAGLPHGALDPLLARAAGVWRSAWGLALFLLGYLALAVGVVAVWAVQPGITLALFLLLSAWHFAGDWRGELEAPARAAAGAAVLLVPALFQREAVAGVFVHLVPAAAAGGVAEAMHYLALPALLALMVLGAPALRHGRWLTAELTTIVLLAWLLSPLLYFTVYFCALHSPRHMLGMRPLRGVSRRALIATAAALTMAAVAFGALAYPLLSPVDWDTRLLRVVFIGLAALTVPHMLLVEFVARRGRAGPPR